ncbi:secretin N-terminal domain-containing protein [Thermostilla marina]
MQGRTRIRWIARTIIWGCLVAVTTIHLPAVAQSTGNYQAYSVQNGDLQKIRGILTQVLPPGTDVVVDPAGRRVLVSGDAQSQQLAGQLVRSLDASQPKNAVEPAVRSPATTPAAGSSLKVYRCPPDRLASTAARLQAAFASNPQVRIVSDVRTSQLLVTAPADLHPVIATEILNASAAEPVQSQVPQPAQTTSVHQVGSAGSKNTTVADVPLWNVSGERLAQLLRDNLGDRLEPVNDPSAPPHTYRITLSTGEPMGLAIDTQANRVRIAAPQWAMPTAKQLVQLLDTPVPSSNHTMTLVALQQTESNTARRATEAIRSANQEVARPESAQPSAQLQARTHNPVVDMLLAQAEVPQSSAEETSPEAGEEGEAAPAGNLTEGLEGGLIGPVEIEFLEGLDVLVVRGNRRDVQRVMQIIQQIEQLSVQTEPEIRVVPMKHVDCEALAEIIYDVYDDVFAARRGDVSLTPLVKPNALLLVGRKEAIGTVLQLVAKLDKPVDPGTEFRVFRLKHASSTTVEETLTNFYEERGGLGTKILVASDYRSNAVIVHAAARDMAEIEAMINELDTPTSEAVNEIKVFKLKNSLASELAPVLQEAISGQLGLGRGTIGQSATGQLARAQSIGGQQTNEIRSTRLRLVTVDTAQNKLLESGILTDVRITADTRTNSLIVAAPSDSMPLITALIEELDDLPAAESQVKVFTILNGDASNLMDMLQSLFGQTTATTSQPAYRTGAQEGESSLIPLRFAVDVRTNSIIATGSEGDLTIVEAILLRLDEADVQERETAVFRLKNAPAEDVAEAINEFLSNERNIRQFTPGLMSTFELVQKEVVIVPETVNNALIVSATPQFFDEISRLVEELDARPPMVLIQVLIAEVLLSNTDQFGVELGIQDPILFDRSVAGVPGFLFNSMNPLGNSSSSSALASSNVVGAQAISNFGVGRGDPTLGFGGLVVQASSESVNVLLRALRAQRRLDILSRPQVMALDNQAAYIQVGQQVPTVTGTTINSNAQTNSITYQNTGIILLVRPRISPDGQVIMEVNAEKSDVGPESEGIAISVAADGTVLRAPRIDTTRAQTTVSAADGQTIILGGLITKRGEKEQRRVPGIDSIPIIRHLFRYDADDCVKTELLIILTPHIVSSEADLQRLRELETARMHWCLADVISVHGDLEGGEAKLPTELPTRVFYDDEQQTPAPTPAPAQPTPEFPEPQAAPQPVPQEGAFGPNVDGNASVVYQPYYVEPAGSREQRGPQLNPLRVANRSAK